MAFSAHKTAEELEEIYDDEKTLNQKVDELAKLVRNSKHFISFIGAGLSTSCGIPDFRGPQGVWTLAAQGKQRTAKSVSTLEAIPAFGHRTLKKLTDEGLMKYIISTNCDGLLLRTDVDQTKLVEIHGNTNKERCAQCNAQFFRDEHVRNHSNHVHDHSIARNCPKCGGQLNDTIINFNENLHQSDVDNAYYHAKRADLCLVLGSSLRVSVWAVETVAKNPKAKVVIINLQRTPFDSNALHIFAKTDVVLQMLMQRLGMTVPNWELHRRVKVSVSKAAASNQLTLYAGGIDEVGNNYNFTPGLKADFGNGKSVAFKNSTNLPYKLESSTMNGKQTVNLTFHFVGHYAEQPTTISIPLDKLIQKVDDTTIYHLFWNVNTNTWRIENEFLEHDSDDRVKDDDVVVSMKATKITTANENNNNNKSTKA